MDFFQEINKVFSNKYAIFTKLLKFSIIKTQFLPVLLKKKNLLGSAIPSKNLKTYF